MIPQKKHGGVPVGAFPRERADGIHPDSHHQGWMPEGSPFVKQHWRAADPPSRYTHQDKELERKRDFNGRIWQYVADHKQQVIDWKRQQGEESDCVPLDLETDALRPLPDVYDVVPDELVRRLRAALESKDKERIATTFQELEQYDVGDDYSAEDRVRWFHKILSEAWNQEINKDKKGMGRLIFDSLEQTMPETLQEVSKDVKSHWDYEEAQLRAMFHKTDRELSDMPEGINMRDVNCSVIRASSTDDDWETTAIFGGQPGVLYGAHCAATYEAWPTYSMWSAQSREEMTSAGFHLQNDWDATYPKADGRF